MKRFFDILSTDEIEKIHAASLEAAANVGMQMEDEDVLKELSDKGARVDFKKKRVFFSPEQMEKALKLTPSTIHCGSRDNAFNFDAVSGGPITTARAAGGAIEIFDPLTDTKRRITSQDCMDYAKIIDGLPNVQIVGTPTPRDLPEKTYDIHTMVNMAKNTQKHLWVLTVGSENLAYELKIAEVLAGNKEALAKRPLMSGIVCIIDPFFMPSDEIKRLKLYGEYNIPVRVPLVPVTGITAPYTIAGTIVHANAEFLLINTIIQHLTPGLGCYYYLLPKSMDIRTTAMLGASSPENGMVISAVAQLARHYGVPSAISGASGTCCQSHQLMHQYGSAIQTLTMAGASEISVMGHITGSLQCSPTFAVICDEILAMGNRFMQDIDMSEAALGVEAIKRVGPRGDFLTDKHTMEFLRKETHFTPTIFDWTDYNTWEQKEKETLIQRADAKRQKLLAEHEVPPLDPLVEKEVSKILYAADKALG